MKPVMVRRMGSPFVRVEGAYQDTEHARNVRSAIEGVFPACSARLRAAWRARLPGQRRTRGGSLFDNVIRAQQQRRREGEAEGFGGLEVNQQLKSGRLFNG